MAEIIYVDNQFIPAEQAVVSIKTHALQYGTGCFEGIRAYYNEKDSSLYAFRLTDHFKRLALSAKILFITLPHDTEKLVSITTELLEKNFAPTDIYIRPVAFKGDLSVGNFNLTELKDSFAIYTVPMGRYLNTEKGIRATLSSWRRVSDNSIPPRAKVTGSYVNTALAKTESLLNGSDEALLMDNTGHVVEGSAENLFLVKNNTVVTPALSDDILIGITRDTLLTLLKEKLNLPVVERSIGRTEIYTADEIFLVGTGAEVTPVVEVDKRPVGNGSIGPVAKQLKDLYFQLVHGELPEYKHWVTKITAPGK